MKNHARRSQVYLRRSVSRSLIQNCCPRKFSCIAVIKRMVSILFSSFALFLTLINHAASVESGGREACDSSGPMVGLYYGEKDPTVYIEVNVISESLLSFKMYLISRTVAEDEETVITQPVFGHLPRLEYLFHPSNCSISFQDTISHKAILSTLGDAPPESFESVAQFYTRMLEFVPDVIRNQLPPEMSATMDSDGFIGLMNMLWVEPSKDPVDWRIKISDINTANGLNFTTKNLFPSPTPVELRGSILPSVSPPPTQPVSSHSSLPPLSVQFTAYVVISVWSML